MKPAEGNPGHCCKELSFIRHNKRDVNGVNVLIGVCVFAWPCLFVFSIRFFVVGYFPAVFYFKVEYIIFGCVAVILSVG